MATGGIFQLITNDGKQDRMLMASALLKQRLDAARARRIASGNPDCTPTLFDIERTHILFTNAHFKPFAAIGYEYNKVTPSAGSSSLGSTVTFSIPQFGDFFNDMVVHATLTQPAFTAGSSTAVGDQNLMRWCAYPGERLLKNVKFEVNGNPLDEYNRDAVNFHREFSVQPNKMSGWNRCVGQEEAETGFLDQPNWASSGIPSSEVVHRQVIQTRSGNQTPSGQKVGELELFIPLLFWCNKDPRLAIPSVAIPYGQRFINIELASQDELVGVVGRGANAAAPFAESVLGTGGTLAQGGVLRSIELYINNIFVNPEVHNIFIKRIGFTLIRVHRRQTFATDGGSDISVLLQQLKWPIEALFMGIRPSDYNSSSPVLNRSYLDRWHKFCAVVDTTRASQGWYARRAAVTSGPTVDAVITSVGVVTYALGTAFAGATLTAATSIAAVPIGSVLKFSNGGGVFTGTVVSSTATILTFAEVNPGATPGAVQSGGAVAGTTCSLTRMTSSEATAVVAVHRPTISSLTIKAHGIPIYNKFPAKFYNAYLPYHYGGPNVKTPDDCGALMITFCLYPGTYQPSGHINVSRAREFYVEFTTEPGVGPGYISPTFRGDLIIIASAINFLLISDGSAVLRYST